MAFSGDRPVVWRKCRGDTLRAGEVFAPEVVGGCTLASELLKQVSFDLFLPLCHAWLSCFWQLSPVVGRGVSVLK